MWERKIRFCLDIASGMLFLHTRSPPMIHRDLKADNVLVSEHYEVKIADFGTAARLRSEGGISQRDVLRGSPLWIAPELLKDDSTSDDVTTANDVYSFAMLLYEVASGFLPFQDAEGNFLYDDNFQLYRDVVAGVRPQIPMRCHATLKSLMTKCWESDPARRPAFKYISEQLADADLPPLVGSPGTQNGPAGSYRDVMPIPIQGGVVDAEHE
jgi:serine/threonine protein kinase